MTGTLIQFKCTLLLHHDDIPQMLDQLHGIPIPTVTYIAEFRQLVSRPELVLQFSGGQPQDSHLTCVFIYERRSHLLSTSALQETHCIGSSLLRIGFQQLTYSAAALGIDNGVAGWVALHSVWEHGPLDLHLAWLPLSLSLELERWGDVVELVQIVRHTVECDVSVHRP